MKDRMLPIAVVVAAIAAAITHNMLNSRPIAELVAQEIFYEQSGLTIQVPEDSAVEIYADFVIITRPDGLATMVPNHRIHAIDGRAR